MNVIVSQLDPTWQENPGAVLYRFFTGKEHSRVIIEW